MNQAAVRAKALAALTRQLRLSARAALSEASVGRHLRRRAGASREFREHRPYVPGDDVRQLDWRAFARTGRPVVKRFEDEGQLRLSVGIDPSASLHFGEGGSHKLRWLAVLAQALIELAARQEDAAGLWWLGRQAGTRMPSAGSGMPQRLAADLAAGLSQRPRADSAALAPAAGAPVLSRRPQRVVLLGDWLPPWSLPGADGSCALGALLCRLRSRGHRVDVVQVVHPLEADFPFRGATTFAAEANVPPARTDATAARSGYTHAFRQFQAHLELICRQAQVPLWSARSDQPVSPLLQRISATSSKTALAKHRASVGRRTTA